MDTALKNFDPDRYSIENYFAFSRSLAATEGGGVGAPICGSNVYNHADLDHVWRSGEIIGETNFGGNAADHTGVHQWYRISISPYSPFPSDPNDPGSVPICDGVNWNLNNPVVSSALSGWDLPAPCNTAWRNSILHVGNRHAPNAQACTLLPTNLNLAIIDPVEQGCSFSSSFNGGSCTVGSGSAAGLRGNVAELFATGLIELPRNIEYFTMEFQSTGLSQGDTIALFLDGKQVWQRRGASTIDSQWQSSGPISIADSFGSSRVMIVLYTSAASGASFNWRNLELVFSNSIFENGFE